MEALVAVLAVAVGVGVLIFRTIGNDKAEELWQSRKAAADRDRHGIAGVCRAWDSRSGFGVLVGERGVGPVSVDRESLNGAELHVGDRVIFDWAEPVIGSTGYRRKATRVRRLDARGDRTVS